MAEVGLKSWIAKLERGETIAGHVRDFDPDARKFFALGGVVSTLCVPAFADGRWSGIIAFDDCREERDWSATEIDTIKTMAELVGGAVARAEHLKTLADATRIIENSPTILYRVGPEVSVYTDLRVGERQPLRLRADELLKHPERWPQLHGCRRPAHGAREYARDRRGRGRVPITPNSVCTNRTVRSVWFESHGTALRDRDGQLVAIEGILTDITERKSAESELSFSHNLLTTAIDNSPDAILVVDDGDRVTMLQQTFHRFVGRAGERRSHAGDRRAGARTR